MPTAQGFIIHDEDLLLELEYAAIVDNIFRRTVTDVHRWSARPTAPEFDDVGFLQYFERDVVRDEPPQNGPYWTDT